MYIEVQLESIGFYIGAVGAGGADPTPAISSFEGSESPYTFEATYTNLYTLPVTKLSVVVVAVYVELDPS